MKRVLTTAMIAMTLAGIVHAQAGLTGKWQGTTGNGTPVTLDLDATETTVAGTLTMNGQSLPIGDGKVSANTFTFTVTRGDQTQGFSGEFTEDRLTVWMDRMGRDTAGVLKRAASE